VLRAPSRRFATDTPAVPKMFMQTLIATHLRGA
jgi:hypothetical protein